VGTALVDRVHSDARLAPAAPADRDPVLGPGTAAAGSPPSPQRSGSRARVIAAALRCVSRFGVTKTTVDDIARESGLSRATLYRAFPGGRDEVLGAVVQAEVATYFAELSARLDETDNLEDLLVTVLTVSADQLARHEALRFVLAYEPEVVVPLIAFHGYDQLLAFTSDWLRPYLEPSLGPTQARRVAEWLTRLVTSHVICPPDAVGCDGPPTGSAAQPGAPHAGNRPAARRSGHTSFALHPEPIGEERARRLVRQFVLPGIHVLAASERSGRTADTTSHDYAGET
jgi:AcrR family transcriptional regulator